MLCPINPDILLSSTTDLDLLKQEFEVLVAKQEISVFVYMYNSHICYYRVLVQHLSSQAGQKNTIDLNIPS